MQKGPPPEKRCLTRQGCADDQPQRAACQWRLERTVPAGDITASAKVWFANTPGAAGINTEAAVISCCCSQVSTSRTRVRISTVCYALLQCSTTLCPIATEYALFLFYVSTMIPTPAPATDRDLAYEISVNWHASHLWSYLDIEPTKGKYVCVKVPFGTIKRMFSSESWHHHCVHFTSPLRTRRGRLLIGFPGGYCPSDRLGEPRHPESAPLQRSR